MSTTCGTQTSQIRCHLNIQQSHERGSVLKDSKALTLNHSPSEDPKQSQQVQRARPREGGSGAECRHWAHIGGGEHATHAPRLALGTGPHRPRTSLINQAY